jgi:photosystem II stability/assembly factor-like uncharacterized protein
MTGAKLYTNEGFSYKPESGGGVSNMLPSGFRVFETWIFLAGEETHPSQVSITAYPTMADAIYGQNGVEIKSALIKNPQPLVYPVSDPARVQLNRIATPITFQPSGSVSVLSTKFSAPYKSDDPSGNVVRDLEVTVALKNESVGANNKYGWLAAVIGSDGQWTYLDERTFFWNGPYVTDLGPSQTITKTVKTQVNAGAGSFYLILADVGTESTMTTRDRWVFELGQTPFTGVLVPTPTPAPTDTPAPRLWAQIGLPEDTISSIRITSAGVLYAATNKNKHGVFKSSDSGASWSAVNNGLGDLDVTDLSVSLKNPDLVFAATYKDAWRSLDGGQSWSPVAKGTWQSEAVGPVIFMSDSGEKVIGIGKWIAAYKSSNKGISWQAVYKNTTTVPCDVAVPSPDYKTIYCLYNAQRSIIYKSADDGATWTECAAIGKKYEPKSLLVTPTSPQTLLVGTSGNGIYRSTDNCGSWTAANGTLPKQGSEISINALAADPTNPQRVYAGIDQYGLYQSTDGGKSWQAIDIWSPTGAHKSISTVALSRDGRGQIFVGTSGFGVWKVTK